MLRIRLENLQKVSELYGYDSLNLLSRMTLDVEDIHLVVYHRDPLCTELNHPRNFGNAAKEGLTRTTHWATYYFTNPKSWCAVSERFMTAIPVIQPLAPVPMAPQSVEKTRDWAKTFGAAMRQRSIRQERTMARAETLPSYLYQSEVQPGEPVSRERSDLEEQQEKSGQDEEEDGMLDYDSPKQR